VLKQDQLDHNIGGIALGGGQVNLMKNNPFLLEGGNCAGILCPMEESQGCLWQIQALSSAKGDEVKLNDVTSSIISVSSQVLQSTVK
jgi:hypothetical protein